MFNSIVQNALLLFVTYRAGLCRSGEPGHIDFQFRLLSAKHALTLTAVFAYNKTKKYGERKRARLCTDG